MYIELLNMEGVYLAICGAFVELERKWFGCDFARPFQSNLAVSTISILVVSPPPPIFVVVDHTVVFYQNEDDCRTRHYNLFL